MTKLDSFNIDEFTTNFHNKVSLSNYVIFIDSGEQDDVITYIISNYNAIRKSYKEEGKTFLLLSKVANTQNYLEQLKYHYPRLGKNDILERVNFEVLKNYINYKGNITTGLLSIDTLFKSQFIEFASNSVSNFKKLSEIYLTTYKEKWNSFLAETESDDIIVSGDYNSDDEIKLDDETKKSVEAILEQFKILKESGNLLQTLPIIENYLKTQSTTNLQELSSLNIDDNHNITLTDYNIEIKLSHLTKSIYLLFLNYPGGILLTELHSYKKELLEYYKNVSNRLDFDKMKLSIDELVKPNSNAIYVHLSRIKSNFTKVIHQSIAKHYFIDGAKNKPKKINLRVNLIKWDNPIQIISNNDTTLGILRFLDEENKKWKNLNQE